MFIYDEEDTAASAQPSTSGHFPLFKRVKAAMYSDTRNSLNIVETYKSLSHSGQQRPVMNSCCGRVHQGIYWYLLRVPTLDCWQPCEPGAWMVDSRLYLNGINSSLTIHAFVWVSWCQQSTVHLRAKILEQNYSF
ncbi:hypothetical protein T10_641 [Trichinella papuae]|uniref:Uncharacterized protein n=1 Tax=Trichinella papuae TaxID=268474 RepID=A0A0V1N490_9BILA|nr:hypothetical protein T10_641 [Trichinella papuae]